MEKCLSVDSPNAEINTHMMDSFRDYFTEHTNPMRRIYHITENAKDILVQNEFRLTFAKRADMGISPDYRGEEHKNVFYMSCMRTTTGAYRRSARYPSNELEVENYERISQTLFEIDAYKLLADGYKIVPFNFFMYGSRYSSETEDRILHDKPVIENAKKYIDTLHIYIPDKILEDENYFKYDNAVTAYYLAKRENVKVFVYNKLKYFSALRTDKNINNIIDEKTNDGKSLFLPSYNPTEYTYPEAEEKLSKSIKVLKALLEPTEDKIDNLSKDDLLTFIDVQRITFIRTRPALEYIHDLAKLMRKHQAINTRHLLLKILGSEFLTKNGIEPKYE